MDESFRDIFVSCDNLMVCLSVQYFLSVMITLRPSLFHLNLCEILYLLFLKNPSALNNLIHTVRHAWKPVGETLAVP